MFDYGAMGIIEAGVMDIIKQKQIIVKYLSP